MATTSYGTPMGMGTQPMGMRTSGVRNMNLPMSSARPIEVDENTSNLEEIQGFPVAGTTADGTHFHQDPVTGQMYKMSTDLHQRIPQILADRNSMYSGVINIGVNGRQITTDDEYGNTPIMVDLPTTIIEPPSSIRDIFNKLSAPNIFFDGMIIELEKNKFNNEQRSYFISNEKIPFLDITSNDQKLYEINKQNFVMNGSNNILDGVFKIHEVSMQKYRPINKFIISSTINGKILSDVNYFIPINRFYNR